MVVAAGGVNVHPASTPTGTYGGIDAVSPPPEPQPLYAVDDNPVGSDALANGIHPLAGAGLPSGSRQE